ncbi:hypothetical protein BBJ28_00023444 [Nothophytophthora sp. Chile5]|nr:hypothetical protein BBJ28_00023444 [Nothophytophthora sp. Chile5]
MFAFLLDDYVVIDMACGFGWCGSPAWYFLPGALINGLYEAAIPAIDDLKGSREPFAGNMWCDDHTCIELDTGIRCYEANLSLRRAMTTVLGPTAINERKFTGWFEHGKALGLIWDTSRGTVSIPPDKIEKACGRVRDALHSATVSKTSLERLLGSLRHFATCCPSARAFFQRLQTLATSTRRHHHRPLSASALEDLRWFRAILSKDERFNGIPVSTFGRISSPSVHVHMDASNDGLCALDPALRQFIRLQFTSETKASIAADSTVNSINVRELLSGVLAALLWGPVWSRSATRHPVHICFWIDNVSAVAWTQRRASQQPLAQLYNRLLSLAEFQYDIICSAEHVPGVRNIMADAGSRAWTSDHKLFPVWTNLSCGWTQVPVVPPYDDLSTLWALCSEDTPSQNLPPPSIARTGCSGASSHSTCGGRHD